MPVSTTNSRAIYDALKASGIRLLSALPETWLVHLIRIGGRRPWFCISMYHIPLLMLISYRGEFGERDPWQTEGGGVTEDLLRALRIPFSYLDRPDHVAARIAKAQTLALAANKPVALQLCRDLMWEET